MSIHGSFAGVVLLSMFAAAPQQPPERGTPVTVTLEQITEVRHAKMVEPADEMTSMFDKPRLELRFGIELAENRKLIELREPAKLRAVDSAGTDLTQVDLNIFGRREYIELIQDWDSPPKGFTLTLTPTARAATTFSVSAEAEAVTYRKTKSVHFKATRQWAPLSRDDLGDEAVTVRLETQPQGTQLVFRPGSVRERFEAVKLLQKSGTIDSESTMWNDQQVGYTFGVRIGSAEEVEAQILIRVGLTTVPIVVQLTDQPLP